MKNLGEFFAKTGKLTRLYRRSLAILFLLAVSFQPLQAAQQFQGLCSFVRIQILQELALERVGFLATLEVTNNEGDASITDFSALLTFEGEDASGNIIDVSDRFFVQPPTLSGINAIDGTGIIRPGETATISWFIIPKTTAGGEDASGVYYDVGASLAGNLYGQPIPDSTLLVISDTILVKPEPQLDITYFQPQDVDGDDPFTLDVVESPVPFTLGVLVRNVGFGPARKLTINSEQPRIVENGHGLLVVPRLLGSRVDDNPTDHASLKVNLGDIEPGKCRKGAWDMITTLSGEFIEFKASYTHSSELGGEDTSLIKSLNAYFIVHEVKNDQPGRDDLLDFLADTEPADRLLIPEFLYESDCNVLPVNTLSDVEVLSYTPSTQTATLRATADFENWVFIRADDPAQAKLPIASVVRSDGKVLDPNNYWTHIRYRKPDNLKLTWLNILDFVALGDYTYTIVYEAPASDVVSPATVLRFNGEVQEKNGKYYILPETQMFYTVEDDSPTATWHKIDGEATFRAAYPFNLKTPGEHIVEYYSDDSNANEETHHFATLVVSDQYPQIGNINMDSTSLFIAGDALSVRPTQVNMAFQGVVTASRLDAVVDIFQGIYSYPTLSGIPSTPTAANSAQITVAGEQVDFYKYRLNGGSWSTESPVTDVISLSGLPQGAVTLEVLGRSSYNTYPPDSGAVSANWTVASATPVSITGTPASPGRVTDVTLQVTGATNYCYRVDGAFFRPNINPGDPITLTQLSPGTHTVEVIGNDAVNPCPATTGVAETTVTWVTDHDYGYDLPAAKQVKHTDLGQVDATLANFNWDGRNDSGVVVEPDWYSVRLKLTDGLKRYRYAVQPVRVGDMLADGQPLSDFNAAQQHARAVGNFAVWADQRNGNWDIRARHMVDLHLPDIEVTTGLLNQERPATDGHYVVWEDRQPDGTLDIMIRDLVNLTAAQPVTATPAFDEIKPVVDWPWVIYQRKPVADPSAPWQLMQYNMLTSVTEVVDATTQDQLDPAVHRGRLVWQDWRDVGPGEIYMKDLRTGVVTRITHNTGGQYHPDIFNQWIVWSDNRLGSQLDLYGYNLNRALEIQLTNTPEDENHPDINDLWVVYEEDASGTQKINLRLLHLGNLASVQLTNTASEKQQPSQSGEQLVWTEIDRISGISRTMHGSLPGLQPVFNNRNTVAVTNGMVAHQADAFNLLELWHAQAGVTEITWYSSLLPTPVARTAVWNGSSPTGDNFTLSAGSFLWVKFADSQILELGTDVCSPLNLQAGLNVFSYHCFPDHYSAYKLIHELGLNQVVALRVLDAATGNWQVANVDSGNIVGEDFHIPTLGVVMIEIQSGQSNWKPGGQ